MNARDLFTANLGLIDRIIAIVCRRANLFGADAEDFASETKLALIDDDYAILRKHEGRASLETFLTVVIRRLLADSRTRAKGRWHASTEAQRLGATAVLAETLVLRDGRSHDEALAHIRAVDPGITRESLESLLKRLPERTGRPRAVHLEGIANAVAGGEAADARALAGDTNRISARAGNALRELLAELPTEDRVLLRMRFGSEMSIADISRILRLPQRPLYRRIEWLLARLRNALTDAGIDRKTAAELVGSDAMEMDFGLRNGKTPPPSQSIGDVKQAREDS
ncbi:MAG TPA: sigma-70 family RNA polymerase sigma factor [Thermoanaerobaculia bacterium]|nr:sigma-70 family RNA polymerase sigma factor [Thermoanaerobaculia bacterium]